MAQISLKERMSDAEGAMTGFDYLRIILSICVVLWHSIALSGSAQLDSDIWSGPWRCFPAAILPMFFSLSGFLVAGSLIRNKLHHFVLLRALRLLPALAVEITLSAVLIGAAFTALPLKEYFTNHYFFTYFLNIFGFIQYNLPGVFLNNPAGATVNGQLWTIPYELECYIGLIALALFGLIQRKSLFVLAVLLLAILGTAWLLYARPTGLASHIPGRALVLAFLCAVGLYLYRDKVPYSNLLGVSSLIVGFASLTLPSLSYLSVIPMSYATVWLGMMRFPPIPFGDLSYGVYLFHFPIEQSAVHLSPWIMEWWELSAICLPITTVFAWLSWNFIEHPALTHKRAVLQIVDKIAIRFASKPANQQPLYSGSATKNQG